MRIDDAGPRTWLLVGVASWAVLAWFLALAGMGGRVEPLPPDPSLLQPLPQVRTTATPRLGAADQYSEIANRPLFNVDRRPQPFELQGPADAAAVSRAFDYVLTGVLITPQLQMATLQPPDGSDTVRVRVGQAPEALRSWRLVELLERSAVFEGPDGRRTVGLRVYDGVGGAPPTAITPPPRPGAVAPAGASAQQRPEPGRTDNGQPATVPSAPTPAPTPQADTASQPSREPVGQPADQSSVQPANDQAQMEAIRQRIQERRRKLRGENPTQPPAQSP